MRFAQAVLSIVVAALLPCGCRRGGEPQAAGTPPAEAAAPAAPGAPVPGQPPTGIFYPTDPVVFTRGAAAGPLVPYTTGGAATSFRADPPLPAGLSLDPATGAIAGTPDAAQPAATYQITARNAAGTFTKPITLAVNDPAPGQDVKVDLPKALTAGDPGQTASTQDQGAGATYTWTLTGATLTAGQGSPRITFTAGGPGTVTVEVTVSTSGGAATGKAEAQASAAPDSTLTLPTWVRPGAAGAQASVPAQPGMAYAWSLVPGSASGTLASGQGTNQISFTAGAAPGTFQVEVTVTNPAGKSSTNRGTITVKTS